MRPVATNSLASANTIGVCNAAFMAGPVCDKFGGGFSGWRNLWQREERSRISFGCKDSPIRRGPHGAKRS
jgi:hypothetical protein